MLKLAILPSILLTLISGSNVMVCPRYKITPPNPYQCAIDVNAKVNDNRTILVFMNLSISFTMRLTDETDQQGFSAEIYSNHSQNRLLSDDGTFPTAAGQINAYNNLVDPIGRQIFFRLILKGQDTNWYPQWKIDDELWTSNTTSKFSFGNHGQRLQFFIAGGTEFELQRIFSCTKQ